MVSSVWNKCLEVLATPDVSELASNGPAEFFVTKNGKRLQLTVPEMSDEEYCDSIYRLVDYVSSSFDLDMGNYLFEGALRFSSAEHGNVRARCHIVLPPATELPQVTIAKKSTKLTTLQGIASTGSMSTEMLNFLRTAVQANLTVAISGGTGAGKDLRKDTLIPTPSGLKKLADIRVGDEVLNESYAPVQVTGKYRPLDPRHFTLSLDNGEKIRAGMGHLWLVRDETLPSVSPGFLSRDTVKRLKTLASKHSVNDVVKLQDIIDATNSSHAILPLKLQGYAFGRRFGDMLHISKRDVLEHVYSLRNTSPDVVKRLEEYPLNDMTIGVMSDILGVHRYVLDRIVPGCLDILDSFVVNVREFIHHLCLLNDKDTHRLVNQTVLKTTLELFEESLDGKRFSIPDFMGSSDVDIVSLYENQDSTEDYYCLSVDSDSRLFLCTESRVPTHNTTMLESLTKLFPNGERIGVAEDIPELELIQPNVAYVHSVPWRPGMDENDVATLSWVVKQFQRMRIDKIVVGETRGPEFADFLVAANSGMEGSLTTIHANDPVRCLDKMTRFASLGSPGQPVRLINKSIAESIDVIVQLRKFSSGIYRVTSIREVTPVVSDNTDAGISTQALYEYVSEQDAFVKRNNMTDSLRSKLDAKGFEPGEFISTPIGALQRGYAGTPPTRPAGSASSGNPFAGMGNRKL